MPQKSSRSMGSFLAEVLTGCPLNMSVELYCSPDINNLLSNKKDKYTADCKCGMFSFSYP